MVANQQTCLGEIIPRTIGKEKKTRSGGGENDNCGRYKIEEICAQIGFKEVR